MWRSSTGLQYLTGGSTFLDLAMTQGTIMSSEDHVGPLGARSPSTSSHSVGRRTFSRSDSVALGDHSNADDLPHSDDVGNAEFRGLVRKGTIDGITSPLADNRPSRRVSARKSVELNPFLMHDGKAGSTVTDCPKNHGLKLFVSPLGRAMSEKVFLGQLISMVRSCWSVC